MSLPHVPTLSTRKPEIGNPDAGQDLYGLGVRIGFYLQSLGMLLYMYSGKKDYGQGLKLASGSITISMLASWFGFAARGTFSPAEATIVLLIIISLNFPAKATLANSHTVIGEMPGLIAMLAVELATCAALLWTFARLVVGDLPTLGTANVVFFFAEVRLDGWFRCLALVYCAVDALTSLLFAYKLVRVAKVVGNLYFGGGSGARSDQTRTEPSEEILEEIDTIMDWKHVEKFALYLAWPLWVLVVVAVELTIQWNHLTPSIDLQTPGQLMPLIAGIIVLIDAVLVVGRHIIPLCMGPILRRIPSFDLYSIRTILEIICRGLRQLAKQGGSHSSCSFPLTFLRGVGNDTASVGEV